MTIPPSSKSGSARDAAVEYVDRVHGYTVEFSNSPDAHRAHYDAVAEVIEHFWPAWWTCGSCHATWPKDHEPDFCGGCNVRLRRNDDIRLALSEAMAASA